MNRSIGLLFLALISTSVFADDFSSATDEDLTKEFASRFLAKSPTFGQIVNVACVRKGSDTLTTLVAVKEGHAYPTLRQNNLAYYRTLAACEKAKSQVPTKVTELTRFGLCVSNGAESPRYTHATYSVSPDNSEIECLGPNGEYPFSSIDDCVK